MNYVTLLRVDEADTSVPDNWTVSPYTYFRSATIPSHRATIVCRDFVLKSVTMCVFDVNSSATLGSITCNDNLKIYSFVLQNCANEIDEIDMYVFINSFAKLLLNCHFMLFFLFCMLLSWICES